MLARRAPGRRPRGAARRCTTARSAARTRTAAGRRPPRASAGSAPLTRRVTRAWSREGPAGCADRARPSSPCRSWRGSPRPRRPRRSDRCGAPSPCRGSPSCPRATARHTRARPPPSRHARRAPPRTARSPGATSRVARDRRRGRARGSGRCGRGPGPGPASRRSRCSRGPRSRRPRACTGPRRGRSRRRAWRHLRRARDARSRS